MDLSQVKAQTREYLGRFISNHQLQDGDDIFALGFVSSLFAMQLVQFVESQFGIAVLSEDLEIDNFRSVDAIASLVARRLS